MTAIDDLRSLLPVPPSVARPAIDWVAVEQRIGIPLPDDYEQLAGSYGESEFSSIVRRLLVGRCAESGAEERDELGADPVLGEAVGSGAQG